jgi:hypothetical protein
LTTRAIVLGAAIGIAYVLSPLTVWFAVAACFILHWAERGLPDEQRRWLRGLLTVAIVLRVLAVLALFVVTDHARVPFGTFFGDEDFFIKRSIWLRNLALGVPIHSADLIYAFDEVGMTSYLYVLAWLQVLVGPSPYGVHLVGVALYIAALVLLFRLVHRTLGHIPAFAALIVLLFMPTLFAWSVSALKESAFLLLTACTIVAAEMVVRDPRWLRRAAALVAIALFTIALESIRRAGALLTLTSLAGGWGAAAIITRPKVLIGTLVAVPIVLGAALSRPSVQVRAYEAVKVGAAQHRGHINTPGYVYKTLEDRFYISDEDLADMRFLEAARFVVRSVVSYIAVPVPWRVESRSMLVYVPEQMIWYVMIALVPFGFVASLKRDPLVACLLLTFAILSALLVALVSGNVGTLVRHRGMVIPLIVWLSAVGGLELMRKQAQWR